MGLIQTVQTYDESKGAFSTWAGIYIKMEIQKVLGLSRRDQRSDHEAASLDEILPGAEDIMLLDTLEALDNIEGEYDYNELIQGVRGIVDTLTGLERELVELHDLQGIGLSAVGRVCGLTPSATNHIHSKAIQNLCRNPRLRVLAKAHDLDQVTSWYQHVGIERYESTWMSSTYCILV